MGFRGVVQSKVHPPTPPCLPRKLLPGSPQRAGGRRSAGEGTQARSPALALALT